MGSCQFRAQVATAATFTVLILTLPASAAAACETPGDAGYRVVFPQGEEAPVKLYKTRKGGRLGKVSAAEIKSGLLLCSDKIDSVNEVRLPQGVAIQLEADKAVTADHRYWVRSNQIRFESLTAQNVKTFACERNQVKTRVAGGAAGAESCKQ